LAHFFCWFFVCFFGTYNLAQITGRDARARQLVWVVLELAGGVRRAAKLAHGFGGEAGDSESILPVLKKQCCGYRLAKKLRARS